MQLAVERADADQVAEMRQAHEALRAAQEGPGPRSEAATLNAVWHATIYKHAGSPLLTEFISRLWSGVPVEAVWRSRRAARSLEEHEEIMLAIERGDALGARELMRRHIETGVTTTIQNMRAAGKR